jgi:hypothetical protein
MKGAILPGFTAEAGFRTVPQSVPFPSGSTVWADSAVNGSVMPQIRNTEGDECPVPTCSSGDGLETCCCPGKLCVVSEKYCYCANADDPIIAHASTPAAPDRFAAGWF